jgi:hypothetical protein
MADDVLEGGERRRDVCIDGGGGSWQEPAGRFPTTPTGFISHDELNGQTVWRVQIGR